MLNIRQTKHLARTLETSVERLTKVLESAETYYEELVLLDPAKPEKPRNVVNVRGVMRGLQGRFYRRVLLSKLVPSPHSHGGVPGRHIKSNAGAHSHSSFVFKTDIENFYPTIHHTRVYRLFVNELKCSPDVARLCTKLCTYRHHLALGLITSPILADRILEPVDRRIAVACRSAGLTYTRYVDDITLSGPYDLVHSGFPRIVERILCQNGFRVNRKKHEFGKLSDGIVITGVRVKAGHLDVCENYAAELHRQLDDAASLARGDAFTGPYYLRSQIRGRVHFVCWVNPGRRRELMRSYRSIPWPLVEAEAQKRGLVVARKRLTTKNPGNSV